MTTSGARLILGATAAGCVGVLLSIPQAVVPREGPGLWLDAGAIRDVVSAEDAADAPDESEATQRLLELFGDQGVAEAGEGESREEFAAREREIMTTLASLMADDEAATEGLRAQAMRRLEPALAGELSGEEEQRVLGTFPRMLERYGAAVNGAVLAPDFVVRTLYKARWNAIHRRELTEGFAPVELQAYWGWLVFHAHGAPLARRVEGLARYEAADGEGGDEARAYLAFLNGESARASADYAALHEKSGSLRARNHALGTGVPLD